MKKFPSQYTIRFRKNVDSRILEFADSQGNFSDTILYLIEKEIAENGIRNLQEILPPVRNILTGGDLKNESNKKKVTTINIADPIVEVAAPFEKKQPKAIEVKEPKKREIEEEIPREIESIIIPRNVEKNQVIEVVEKLKIQEEIEEIDIPPEYLD